MTKIKKFSEFNSNDNNEYKFSLPTVECGIGRKRNKLNNGISSETDRETDKKPNKKDEMVNGGKKIEESMFIPYNKAKHKGLLGKKEVDSELHDCDSLYRYNKRRGEKDLQLSGDEGEKDSNDPRDEDEKRAIHRFTDDESYYVNKKLHRIHSGKVDELEPHHEELISNLDNILNRRKLSEDGIYYTGLGNKIHSNIGGMLKRGIFYNPAYTSVSHSFPTAAGFSSADNKKTHHVLEMHLPKGYKGIYVEPYTSNGGEYETILPRDISFRVHKRPKVHINDYGKVIHVWKATPIKKELAKELHNKEVNKLINGSKLDEFKDYYEHEIGNKDREKIPVINDKYSEKHYEYLNNKKNHSLLALNPYISTEIKHKLIDTNNKEINKYFAKNDNDSDIQKRLIEHKNELLKNPNLSDELIDHYIKNGDDKDRNEIHNIISDNREKNHHLNNLIKYGNNDLAKKIAKKDYFDLSGSYHKKHYEELFNKNIPEITDKLYLKKHDSDSDLPLKLFKMGNEEQKSNLVYNSGNDNSELVHHIIKHGNSDHISNLLEKHIYGTPMSSTNLDLIVKNLHKHDEGYKKNLIDKLIRAHQYGTVENGTYVYKKLHPAIADNSEEIKNHIKNKDAHEMLLHNLYLTPEHIDDMIKHGGEDTKRLIKSNINDIKSYSINKENLKHKLGI